MELELRELSQHFMDHTMGHAVSGEFDFTAILIPALATLVGAIVVGYFAWLVAKKQLKQNLEITRIRIESDIENADFLAKEAKKTAEENQKHDRLVTRVQRDIDLLERFSGKLDSLFEAANDFYHANADTDISQVTVSQRVPNYTRAITFAKIHSIGKLIKFDMQQVDRGYQQFIDKWAKQATKIDTVELLKLLDADLTNIAQIHAALLHRIQKKIEELNQQMDEYTGVDL